MNTNTAIIQGSRITKRYGSLKALDGVSFSVRRGDIYGLVGDNGAGDCVNIRLS